MCQVSSDDLRGAEVPPVDQLEVWGHAASVGPGPEVCLGRGVGLGRGPGGGTAPDQRNRFFRPEPFADSISGGAVGNFVMFEFATLYFFVIHLSIRLFT